MKPDILKLVDEYLAKGWPEIYADTLLRELLTEHRRLKIIFRAKRRAKTQKLTPKVAHRTATINDINSLQQKGFPI